MDQAKTNLQQLKLIAAQFVTEGTCQSIVRIPSGHINETYCLTYYLNSGWKRFVLQKINTNVFQKPELLMENILRVINFAREKIIISGGDPLRQTLTLVPTKNGLCYFKTPAGEYWRIYHYIEGARTVESPENPEQVYNASRAFGRFQKLVADLPGPRLHETISGFHHTRNRFQAFLEAVDQDPVNRSIEVKPEITFALEREKEVDLIINGLNHKTIPERIAHNDTKLNNVMFDYLTNEGICVIDLDTVMPGSVLYDFGDSVRLGASLEAEDERNLSKTFFSLELFDRLAAGYLDSVRDFLLPSEIDLLAFSARLMTYECGLRFLTDYLKGDVYFRIHHPSHNLDRCRAQFKLLREMEKLFPRMEKIIKNYL